MSSLVKFICFVHIALMCNYYSYAQIDYSKTDSMVSRLGPLDKFNVATIADTITYRLQDKAQKARAIFFWIANNIALDAKAIRGQDNKNVEPENVIAKRKTTPLGFSLLFQEMCSQANIRCLSVDGYIKVSTEDIDEILDAAFYSWNVIQLGTSPTEWYYVDCAQASGFLDSKKTIFTKQFSPQYFFPDKSVFNLEHFPDNKAWLLGEGIVNIKAFYSLPLIHPAAYVYRLSSPDPLNGKIKTHSGDPVHFEFTLKSLNDGGNFSIVTGEGIKKSKPERLNAKSNGNRINFDYAFKKEDTYPATILVDGKELITYLVEVE